MVYIGNQTSCWAAPTEPFDYAVSQAFDAFEWFPDKKPEGGWDEEDLTEQARRAIAEAARNRGMRLSVHARWQANLLTADGVALFWKDLDLARDLGAALINIHLIHEQGVPAFVEALLPLIRRTAEAGLQLAIENTPHHSPEQFNELFGRLRALDSVQTTHVGMCLDLGHANLCAATRNDYLGFYDRLEPHLPLIHLHLHENWGDTDSHLPLFTGPASRDDSGIRGLVARLKKRDYSGSLILEQWPHPPSLLNNARDRLRQLWQPETTASRPCSASTASTRSQPIPPRPSGTHFVAELTEGDRTRRSWREKLDFVRDLLADEAREITDEDLIDIAIYLRFLSTGEIVCSEDGRHFRPAQHARLASQIQDRLAVLTTAENRFILRKIYPWLPSAAPTFQRPEPLTRIRDIAHRNDIPQDLKREIKTTLQNKLHRCAGPEDLATSTALLERITTPGASYSPAFVDQFKIFHEELKEFFNAQSLNQRLEAIIPAVAPQTAQLIQQFLKQKTSQGGSEQLDAFRTLTSLRQDLLDLVARKPGAETEAILLADIALEDFAFVLLSELINIYQKSDASSATEWQTDALILSLENLALSGVEPTESRALVNELGAWGKPSAGRNESLRQKATLQRCRRLAEAFGARTIALLSARAENLGRALGVEEHAIRVFSEADLRSHIVFQVSKLATSSLQRTRRQLKLPPWDVLVPGRAVGRATTLASFDDWQRDAQDPALILLKQAVGDEEIPSNVVGILLGHEMPHLSHLAVRARQAGIVFVACEEPNEFERLQGFQGQTVSLLATPDNVIWKIISPDDSSTADISPSLLLRGERSANPRPFTTQARRAPPRIPSVRLSPKIPYISLEQATTENSGGKATGARRLLELSRQANAGFHTPPALVVPFGVMEEALRALPTVDAEYRQLVLKLHGMPSTEFQVAPRRLRELVQELQVPDVILSEMRRSLSPNAALIVRSSANCEDTEEFAGAGLYDSVINVSPSDVATAIRKVWSSLWTLRAALGRREAGIPHDQAHMAVLVQELVDAEFAFVLHTVNPVTHDPHSLYTEIVVGLGETLVSGATAGEPYRLTCDKQSQAITILAFANFSQALRPNPPGSRSENVRHETLDYSRIDLSRDPATLESLARRLCRIGAVVERTLGRPQDIEGAVVRDKIYLVQARPQQGLASTNQS